jgi:MarR family protein
MILPMGEWTFLTNHATALLCVAENPGLTLRQVGDCVGITERAAHRIVNDLVEEGYLLRTRDGRRNRYEVRPEVLMRDPLLKDRRVGELLAALPVDVSSCIGGGGRVGSTPAIAAEPTVTP